MTNLSVDIAYDTFIDLIGEDAFNGLKNGDDVTHVFKDDFARPMKAIVIQKVGPGGGNPYIEMTFGDDDHAWDWYFKCYGGEPDEFIVHLA